MNQTALNWLYDQIENKGKSIYEVIEQAKAMEKEQIEKAFDDGYAKCGITHNAQEYYNETYKSE